MNHMSTSSAPSTASINAPATSKRSVESTEKIKAEVHDLNFSYGVDRTLKNVGLKVHERMVTALIGPSGCGKTTLLRCFNRMHDFYPGVSYEGKIILHPSGLDILSRDAEPMAMRMHTGMVFQKPNPFPKSIFENVAYGLRIRRAAKDTLEHRVEAALRSASLWDEVKDRLHQSAYGLSGGQQQRLCIARALATEPEMLLLDEPTSAMDPVATAKIEDLIAVLKDQVTILIVTHNMGQAARVSDYMAFMYLGEIIEFGKTADIFQNPTHELTAKYLTGRFG